MGEPRRVGLSVKEKEKVGGRQGEQERVFLPKAHRSLFSNQSAGLPPSAATENPSVKSHFP